MAVTMPDPRPAPFRIADDLALDFLNTRIAPPDAPSIDWLADGADLLAWLAGSGGEAARAAAAAAGMPAAALDRLAAEARALRESWRAFVLARAGRPLPATALADLPELTALLAEDTAVRALVAEDAPPAPFALVWRRSGGSPRRLLLPLAEAMAELVAGADFRQVRRCQGRGCSLLFHDRTRRRQRRWCDMALCGNRAKQAAHRARRRGA